MSENTNTPSDNSENVAPPVPAAPPGYTVPPGISDSFGKGNFSGYHSTEEAQQLGGPYQPLPQPPVPPKTNTLAVVSLVSAFFISLVAVITGHIALGQIKRTGESGRGLALAGVVLGYLGLVVGAIVSAVMVTSLMAVGTSGSDSAVSTLTPTDNSTVSVELITEVTPDFCEKFTVMTTKSQETIGPDATGKLPADVIEAYQQLGSIPSPNQQVYLDFAELLANPESATDVDLANEAANDFTTAMIADLTSCNALVTG